MQSDFRPGVELRQRSARGMLEGKEDKDLGHGLFMRGLWLTVPMIRLCHCFLSMVYFLSAQG